MAEHSSLRPPSMKRRTFLKAAAALGGAAALGAGAEAGASGARLAESAAPGSPVKQVYSACAVECLHCSLIAEVQDGQVVNIKGNPSFNTQPCLRGLSRAQWINSPDRILYPMKRVGEKGSGQLQRISWDEALDTVAARMKEVNASVGPKGFLYIGGSGNFGQLMRTVTTAFFSYLGGSTPTLGQLCCAAVTEAMYGMLGDRYYEFRDTFDQSRYIISWGNNPVVTSQGYFKNIEAAQRAGAKLVVIDPRYSETASKADEWIPIKPGTDTALAMGMLRVIVGEHRHDEDFLLTRTGAPFLLNRADGKLALLANPADSTPKAAGGEEGPQLSFDTPGIKRLTLADGKPQVMDSGTGQPVAFDTPGVRPLLSVSGGSYQTVYDAILAEIEPFTPQAVERVTGVPAGTVERLAREFSSVKPAAIEQNMSGAQRTEFGSYTVMSQLYLAAFTGNFGFPGAGVNDTGGVNQMFPMPPAIPARKNPPIPGIPCTKLGEWLVAEKPHKIHLMWVGPSSPLSQYPNTNKVREALTKVPFLVVVNNRMIEETKYADIVLPVTTLWESLDVLVSTRSHYVQLMDKGVEPKGEAHSDAWIFSNLAQRMGFGDRFAQSEEELVNGVLKTWNVTADDIRTYGPFDPLPHPWVPWKDGVFKTPTKRLHFYIPSWADKGLSPIVHYYPVSESPEGSPALAARYPLQLTNRKTSRSIHSSFGGGLPWIDEATHAEQILLINPADARPRGVEDGTYATVVNDRGRLRVRAHVTDWITAGVVSLENGWWPKEGGSSSILTNDASEAVSNGHTLNSTLVQVVKEA